MRIPTFHYHSLIRVLSRTVNAANSLPVDTLAVLAHPENLPKGDPTHGSTAETVFPVRYDASKASKIFGAKYHTIRDSTKDMVENFGRRGW